MMHHNGVVVAITDNKGKAYREYDFKQNKSFYNPTKESTVIMPFDSEYAILLKNSNKKQRMLVEIEIDGTNVTDKGVIIDADDKVYLERFVDVARKFKFVRKDSDEVADPTNEDNGRMKITVQLEKKQVSRPIIINHEPPTEVHHHHHYPPVQYPPTTTPGWTGTHQPLTWMTTSDSYTTCNASDATVTREGSLSFGADTSCLRGFAPQDSNTRRLSKSIAQDIGEAGATVEGSDSDQEFNKTTWRGNEGGVFTFEFILRGKEGEINPDLEEYLRLQEKLKKEGFI